MSTKAERETIIRWDLERPIAELCTADPKEAVRWQKLGYVVTVLGRIHGEPRSWETTVPRGAVRLRRLNANGALIKRPVGGAAAARQLARALASERTDDATG